MSGESLKRSTFWNELYWFVAMALVGWILAALILPPRVASLAQLLHQERMVLNDIRTIQSEEDRLEGAVSAWENDPFYRDGVFRKLLGVKKESEIYLEPSLLPSDN